MPVKTHSPYIIYLCQKVSDNELEEVEFCHSDLPKITVICPSVNESCTMKLKQKRTARKSMGGEKLSIDKRNLRRADPNVSYATEINDSTSESPENADSGDKTAIQEAPSDSISSLSPEKNKNPADSSTTSGSEFSWKKAFVVYDESGSESEKSNTRRRRPLRSTADPERSKTVTVASSSSKTDESQSDDETGEQGSKQPVAKSTVQKLKTTRSRKLSSEDGAASPEGSVQADDGDGSKLSDGEKVVTGRGRGRPKGSMGKNNKTIKKPLGERRPRIFKGRPKGSFAKSYFAKKNEVEEDEGSSFHSISSSSAAADVQRKSLVIVLKPLSKAEMKKYKVKEQLKAFADENIEHHSSNVDADQGANSFPGNEPVEEGSDSGIRNARKKKANLPKTGNLKKNIEKWLQTVAVDNTGSPELNVDDKSHTRQHGEANAVKRIGKENASKKKDLVSESGHSSVDDKESDLSFEPEKQQTRSLRKKPEHVSNKRSSDLRKRTRGLTRTVNYDDKRSSSQHSVDDSESSLKSTEKNTSIKKKQGQDSLKISENVEKHGRKKKNMSLPVDYNDSKITTAGKKSSSIDKKAPEKHTTMRRISKRLVIPEEVVVALEREGSDSSDTQVKKRSNKLHNRKSVRYTDDTNSKATSENSFALSSTVKKIIENLDTPTGQDDDSTLESEDRPGIDKNIRSGEEPKSRGRKEKRVILSSETSDGSETSFGLSSNQKKSPKLAKPASKKLQDDIQVRKTDAKNDISENGSKSRGRKKKRVVLSSETSESSFGLSSNQKKSPKLAKPASKKLQDIQVRKTDAKNDISENGSKSRGRKKKRVVVSSETSESSFGLSSNQKKSPKLAKPASKKLQDDIQVRETDAKNDISENGSKRMERHRQKKKIRHQKASAKTSKAEWSDNDSEPRENISVVDLEDEVDVPKKADSELRGERHSRKRKIHSDLKYLPISSKRKNSERSRRSSKQNLREVQDDTSIQEMSDNNSDDVPIKSKFVEKRGRKRIRSVSTEDSEILNEDKIPAKRGLRKKFPASSKKISDAIPSTSRGLSSTTKGAPNISSTEMNNIYLDVQFAGSKTMSVAELFETYNMCPVVDLERLSSDH